VTRDRTTRNCAGIVSRKAAKHAKKSPITRNTFFRIGNGTLRRDLGSHPEILRPTNLPLAPTARHSPQPQRGAISPHSLRQRRAIPQAPKGRNIPSPWQRHGIPVETNPVSPEGATQPPRKLALERPYRARHGGSPKSQGAALGRQGWAAGAPFLPARSALTMTAQGVAEFATVNVSDFDGLGFRKVWSPLWQTLAPAGTIRGFTRVCVD